MRAIGFDTNGSPDVLRELELPVPAPGPGQVLVEVAYAGVNFAEVQHRRGEFGEPDGPGGTDVPGLEVSGHVAALGEGVSGFTEGEAVAAYLPAFGGYAQYAVAPAVFVHPLRTDAGDIPLDVAGGISCVLPTAYGLLEGAGRLRGGDTVLIHAAAGGVGSAAAQLARALGAGRVLGTVGSPDKVGYALSLGYDEVFVRDAFAGSVSGVDLVLDPVGGPVREASLTVLAPFGRVVPFGDAGRHGDWTTSVRDLWKHNRSVSGFNIGDLARRAPALLAGYTRSAFALLAAGKVTVDITAALPLTAAARAHQALEAGTTLGKTVLVVAETQPTQPT